MDLRIIEDNMFSMRSSVFHRYGNAGGKKKKITVLHMYVRLFIFLSECACVCVCRCVTGQHMASPACSEILNSSVSKKGTACV